MDVSIVLCTYNRCESLRKVLSDLDRLTMPSDTKCEILIVDNNSSDNTKTIVETLGKEKPEFFRYAFEPRQGKSFALNRGVRLARGQIIAFTDDDVGVDRDWLMEINEHSNRTIAWA